MNEIKIEFLVSFSSLVLLLFLYSRPSSRVLCVVEPAWSPCIGFGSGATQESGMAPRNSRTEGQKKKKKAAEKDKTKSEAALVPS